MMREIPITSILFLDIETVPQVYNFNDLDPYRRELFANKTRFLQGDPEINYSKAGIYAEFGKIICISAGWIEMQNNKPVLKLKSFYGDGERELLTGFLDFLAEKNLQFNRLCAHNGKEFDFPWLCRRMIINGLKIHPILDLQGKKPWESPHLDTMELWKFGDYKNYTSLELLASVFGIPSPKDDIGGGDVARVYWEENNLEKIVNYCQKDVVALTCIFMRFRGEAPVADIHFPAGNEPGSTLSLKLL